MRLIIHPPLDYLTILWPHTLGTCQVSKSYACWYTHRMKTMHTYRFKQRTYNICRFHNSYCTQCDSVISYAEFPPSLLSVEQSHTSLTLSSATPPPPSQWNTQLQQWSQTSMYTCNSMYYRIAGNFHGVKLLFTKR